MKRKHIPYTETIESLKNLSQIEKKRNFLKEKNILVLLILFCSIFIFIHWFQKNYFITPCLISNTKYNNQILDLRKSILGIFKKIKDLDLRFFKQFK